MSSDPVPARTQIGPYRLDERLGAGGMGEVYRAFAPSGAPVALKVLHATHAREPSARRRFIREARAAARLEHPNVVRMLDFGSADGEFYIAMELIEAGSLADWREAPPDGETAVIVFDQMLAALAFSHARGVIHRDLKPENVLLGLLEDGTPCAKITDFGVVFFRDERDVDMVAATNAVGTPAYMSPEQALHLADASPATDLYSVGVMLFEVLTGRRPFDGVSAAATMMQQISAAVPTVELRPGYEADGDIAAIVERLLAKDPGARFMFASDARRALSAVALRGLPLSDNATSRSPALTTRGLGRTTLETVPRDVMSPFDLGLSAADPDAAPRLFALREAPLVGRDDIVDSLRKAALTSIDRLQVGVSLLAGELGLGKSRLLSRLREVVEENGAMQVWAGAYDGRGEGPEVGLRQALRRGLGVSGLRPAELRLRVGHVLERQGIVDEWERDALCGHLLPPGDAESLAPVGRDEAIWALFERALERAGRDRPVLLVLDDVHLGGVEALRFLRALLSGPRRRRALHVVLTYRPEAVAAGSLFGELLRGLATSADESVCSFTLPRLSEPDMRALVLGSVAGSEEVAAAVADRAEGNPLVAVELLRHLFEVGRLDGAAATSASELLSGVPVALGALLDRRIDEAAARGDANTASLWTRLAFLGLRFPTALAIEAVGGGRVVSDAALERALTVGVMQGILHDDDGGELRFDSALMRDALLSRASHAGPASAELHAEAAEAKTRYFGAAAAEHGAEIARHWAEAGRNDEALRHALLAAEHLRRRGRTAAALDALLLALNVVGEEDEGAATRLAVQLAIADARLRLGEWEAAEAVVRAAALPTPTPGEALRILAELARDRGELRRSRELYAQAAAAFDARGDHGGAAATAVGLGKLELRDGRYQAAEAALRRGSALFERLGDRHAAAGAARELARAALDAGLDDVAKELADGALERFEALGDRHGSALCRLTLGDITRAGGDLAQATSFYTEARSALEAAGDWHAAAIAQLGAGRVALDASDLERARAELLDAHDALTAIGDRHTAALASLRVARIDADQSRWSAVEPRVEALMQQDETERIDDAEFIDGLIALGRHALLDGQPQLSRTLLSTAALKLERTAHGSALYDRVDEVQYLLAELGDGALDGAVGVVDLFADED